MPWDEDLLNQLEDLQEDTHPALLAAWDFVQYCLDTESYSSTEIHRLQAALLECKELGEARKRREEKNNG